MTMSCPIQRVHALSLSTMLQPLLCAKASSLQLLSTHGHACNLLTRTGTIIALVGARYGNGPFHIVLPEVPLNKVIATAKDGCDIGWQQGALACGDIGVDINQALPWNPQLLPLYQMPDKAISYLHEAMAAYAPSPLLVGASALSRRAQTGIAFLHTGLKQFDRHKVRAGVTSLAGLGPGLTPAGDDFLVGLLAALQTASSHQAQKEGDLRSIRTGIAEQAAKHTTRLSAAWLHYAGQGCFGEAWHHLIAALNRSATDAITAAANRILTTGATSGVDAMSGFLFGISLLQEMADN
jgi:hypothetical protein